MYSFPNFETVCCSMSGSNCCFLTCIQVSQETGMVVWYSHLFKKFPQFVVICTVKGFRIVNEAGIDVFLEFPCFLWDPANVGNLICGSSAFSTPSLYIWKFLVHVLLKPRMKDFEHSIASMYECVSRHLCPTLCDSMNCSPKFLCPWRSQGKNTGVGSHFLLQGIFPTQG